MAVQTPSPSVAFLGIPTPDPDEPGPRSGVGTVWLTRPQQPLLTPITQGSLVQIQPTTIKNEG